MCYLLPQYLSSTRKLPCTFTHLYPLSPLTCKYSLPMSIPQPIHLISSPDSSKIYQSVINPLLSRTFLLSLLLQNLHYFCLRMFIFPFYKKKGGGGGFPFTLVLPQLTFHFSTLIHLSKSRKSSLQQLSSFFIMYFFLEFFNFLDSSTHINVLKLPSQRSSMTSKLPNLMVFS